MIQPESVFPIGKIIKTHGVHGEMLFACTTDVFDKQNAPYLICNIDGIYVPFFIDQYRFRSTESVLLRLKGIATDAKAKTMIGLTVYLPNTYLKYTEKTEIELNYFVGFEVIAAHKGTLGTIAEVDQSTDNALFIVDNAGVEILIPVSEAFITSIDHLNKQIFMDLPEGLLDL